MYVEWSEHQIQGSPFKVTITMKGNSHKVKVEGQGLKGGYVGQELRAVVDTSEAGNGTCMYIEIVCTEHCLSHRRERDRDRDTDRQTGRMNYIKKLTSTKEIHCSRKHFAVLVFEQIVMQFVTSH